MQKQLLVFVAGLFSCYHTAIGQANLIAGQVVTHEKDTINGFIDYRNWNKSPDHISFVDSNGGLRKIYGPLDIVSFQVNSEVYVSAIVESETSSRDTQTLNSLLELVTRIDTTFLKTLVNGPKSLYYHKNQLDIENFYIRNGTDFQLLAYKKYRKSIDSKLVVAENRGYIGQLNSYLSDCSPGLDVIRKTPYNNSKLVKLFEIYYNCTDTAPRYVSPKEKMRAEFGLVAGISLTTLSFSGGEFDYLAKTDYSNSTNFSGGMFLNLVIPRSMGRWSSYNELLFTSYKVKGHYMDEIREEFYNEHISEIGRSYLKLVNLIRYKYPIRENFLYFNIGISNGFVISESNEAVYQSVFYDQVRPITPYALEDTRNYEQGLVGGIGFQMSQLSFDLRYENGNGISNVSNLKSSTSRIYFLVGYKF